VTDNKDTITYESTREVFGDHGLVVSVLYWITEIASWLSLGHWLRALPRIDSIQRAVDPKTGKPMAWWQDLVAILYLGATPLAHAMAWGQNSRTACIGSYLAAYLLYDPVVYHIRVLWFDDLKPGIPDSRRGVWSHRRILFLAMAAYVQSIVLFPAIYHRVEQLAEMSQSDLFSRSLSVATSLSLSEPVTSIDLAQLALSLFLLVIVIATTASIAYGRREFAGDEHKKKPANNSLERTGDSAPEARDDANPGS
jgi:hypothetical protein